MTGHAYSIEQDDFIKSNFSNIGNCVRLFNERFGTSISYTAMKSHGRRIGARSILRPWTSDMNESLRDILSRLPYIDATDEFNATHGTSFTVKQVQNHCTKGGIKRGFYQSIKEVDKLIAENIDRPYGEIMGIINERTVFRYRNRTAIGVRANKLGLNRPHNVWKNSGSRQINGEKVPYSEYITYIGNRWHRLPKELQPVALLTVRLQVTLRDLEKENQ